MFKGEKLILFGASAGAMKIADTLNSLSIEFEFFSDNNKNKWDSFVAGKQILSPNKLLEFPCYIIIASIYYTEIYEQLLNLGIDKCRIVSKEQILIAYFDLHWKEFFTNSEEPFIRNGKNVKNNIILDASDGYKLSGAVKWTLNFAEGLRENRINYFIFSKNDEYQNSIEDTFRENEELFDTDYSNYKGAVKDIVHSMKKKLPCTVIINSLAQNFMAAYVLKKKYPKLVKIVSVIHSDFQRIYESNQYLDRWISQYICVSKTIEKKMRSSYQINPDKIRFINSPVVLCHKEYTKRYPDKEDMIQIGYAARIEKAQKRADLLIEVLKLLEKQKVNYHLNIAGTGGFWSQLNDYVTEHQLENKVTLWGMLSYKEMEAFWKENDIFLNVSDCEGMSISMLESMSYGLAPVVTNTSGIDTVIEDNINGYISELENMDSLVENLICLIQNPEKIKIFGEKSKKKIEQICDVKKYVHQILS